MTKLLSSLILSIMTISSTFTFNIPNLPISGQTYRINVVSPYDHYCIRLYLDNNPIIVEEIWVTTSNYSYSHYFSKSDTGREFQVVFSDPTFTYQVGVLGFVDCEDLN